MFSLKIFYQISCIQFSRTENLFVHIRAATSAAIWVLHLSTRLTCHSAMRPIDQTQIGYMLAEQANFPQTCSCIRGLGFLWNSLVIGLYNVLKPLFPWLSGLVKYGVNGQSVLFCKNIIGDSTKSLGTALLYIDWNISCWLGLTRI